MASQLADISMKTSLCLRVAAALVLAAFPAAGQVVLSPVAVIHNTLGESAPEANVTNLINQSGVATPFVSGTTHFDTYFANPGMVFANATATNNWQSQVVFTLPVTGALHFDLGESYTLNKLAIWNISARDVTIRVADAESALETGEIAGSYTLVNHINFPFSYPVDVLNFTNTVSGRYVRLEIESAYTFSPSDTFAYAIIGEVALSASLGGAPTPTVSIRLDSAGEAQVTFSGVLQSSTNVFSDFTDVPGNPTSPYALPAGNQAPEQYFRARGN